jgi:hypothetical protein
MPIRASGKRSPRSAPDRGRAPRTSRGALVRQHRLEVARATAADVERDEHAAVNSPAVHLERHLGELLLRELIADDGRADDGPLRRVRERGRDADAALASSRKRAPRLVNTGLLRWTTSDRTARRRGDCRLRPANAGVCGRQYIARSPRRRFRALWRPGRLAARRPQQRRQCSRPALGRARSTPSANMGTPSIAGSTGGGVTSASAPLGMFVSHSAVSATANGCLSFVLSGQPRSRRTRLIGRPARSSARAALPGGIGDAIARWTANRVDPHPLSSSPAGASLVSRARASCGG